MVHYRGMLAIAGDGEDTLRNPMGD